MTKDASYGPFSLHYILLTEKDHPERVPKYKQYEHEFDEALKDISFQVELKDISKFENRTRLSINVYAYDDDYKIYPLRHTNKNTENHIDLLFVKDNENSHYWWIKDLSGLVSKHMNNHNGKKYLCGRYLINYNSEQKLKKHEEDCLKNIPAKIKMPQNCEVVEFKHYI
jgi:hypothetical protein